MQQLITKAKLLYGLGFPSQGIKEGSELWRMEWLEGGSLEELIRFELEREGASSPLNPSIRGEMGVPIKELRDPVEFENDDESLYLLLTGGGK